MERDSVRGLTGVLLWLVLLSRVALPAAELEPSRTEGVEITYLANEGFLIRSAEHAVLIDALSGDGIGGYPAVPREVRKSMERGEPPFERVDLVLATHHHGDHFDAAAVADFLERHPEALFVSTDQAVERLSAELPEASPARARVRAANPAPGRPARLAHRGLDVQAFALHHGHGMDPPVRNLGFVVEIGGLVLLHVGDTEVTPEEFARSGITEREIDVALLSYWTLDSLGPLVGDARLVAMHLPDPGAPAGYFAPFGDTRDELVSALSAEHPATFLPTEPLETLRLPGDGR